MTASEALAKIKAMFEEVPPAPVAAPVVAPVEAAKDYQLADGTVVQIDKLDIGGSVSIQGEQGATPAPAGNHTLIDGQTITVDESGIITAIAPAPVAEDMTKKQIEELQSQINELRSRHETALAEQAESFSLKFLDYQNKVIALKELVVKLAETPSADPVKIERTYISKSEKLSRFLDSVKKLN